MDKLNYAFTWLTEGGNNMFGQLQLANFEGLGKMEQDIASAASAIETSDAGLTGELGVLLPPLHPRCRCAIMYDEVGTPRATRPKPTINPLLPASIATEIISPATPEPQNGDCSFDSSSCDNRKFKRQ